MAQAEGGIDISHVRKLTRAARKQALTRHEARAVELYERAIAAAEALRQPDCLIVTRLRCWCLDTQYEMHMSALSGDYTADAERRVAAQILALFQAQLPGVLETLERRRAAGTLLTGRCRAHEVAWDADRTRTESLMGGEPEECIAQNGKSVGIAAYFAAARTAVVASHFSQALQPVPEDPLLGCCLNFFEHGLLLTLRQYSPVKLNVSIPNAVMLFLDTFRNIMLPGWKPVEPRCARLLMAWRRLELSGLLQILRVEETRESCESVIQSLADVQAAKDAGVPLRTCALPACGAREAHVGHFKRCGACGGVFYCSKAHQAEHWPTHKAACKAARKAASQAAAEGGASQKQH